MVAARSGKATDLYVSAAKNCLLFHLKAVLQNIPQASAERAMSDNPDPAAIVHAYLAAMEARDLTAAQSHLAPGFTMTFPGGVTMTTLSDLIAWSAPRYRFVKKSYERFDAMPGLVYCFGTLHGEWPDGTPFAGIRFIDRFELSGGLITRQDVWNDMGEARK
jgi:hypothetical protein